MKTGSTRLAFVIVGCIIAAAIVLAAARALCLTFQELVEKVETSLYPRHTQAMSAVIQSMPATKSQDPSRMYFGYGSNLWQEQMKNRCTSSRFMGVGRLSGYRWIINSRGYANVVPTTKAEDVVFGLVYNLTPTDEAALDVNEGVPYAYAKEILNVDFWASKESSKPINVMDAGEKVFMLVYIDRVRTKDDVPKKEYIYRMNMGIQDGVKEGIPQDYVNQVMRPFIPAEGMKNVEALARKQALGFEDER